MAKGKAQRRSYKKIGFQIGDIVTAKGLAGAAREDAEFTFTALAKDLGHKRWEVDRPLYGAKIWFEGDLIHYKVPK